MSYHIDKDIPPPARSAAGRPLKYPWPQMAVGDSILIAGGKQSNVSSAARDWALNQPAPHPRFTTRQERGGIRVWRIA